MPYPYRSVCGASSGLCPYDVYVSGKHKVYSRGIPFYDRIIQYLLDLDYTMKNEY